MTREYQMDLSSDGAAALAKLNQLARDTSLSRIQSICQRDAFTLVENSQFRKVKDHWMAQALISGPHLRAIFCVYFNAQNLKKWSVKVFDREWEEISLPEIHDLSKEYCNLVAGNLKSALDLNQIRVGVSLPFLSRGFDRIFSAAESQRPIHNEIWKIRADDIEIACSTHIEIFKEFRFEIIDDSTDSGDVQFL